MRESPHGLPLSAQPWHGGQGLTHSGDRESPREASELPIWKERKVNEV